MNYPVTIDNGGTVANRVRLQFCSVFRSASVGGQAVSDIGVAVIHGGMSTFLAVVLLSLSSSYVFRVRESNREE